MAAGETISFYLPDDMAKRLALYCTENASNRSAVIRKAIEQFLMENEV